MTWSGASSGEHFLASNPVSLAAGASMAIGGATGGPGNGAIPSQIGALIPLTFLSGTNLGGSDTTHAVVAGDWRSLVGYYYVALGVSNNPSVPIISATFAGGNTTFLISTIIGHTSGQTFEVSFWPAGTAGQSRGAWDAHPNVVYKPLSATTIWQIGVDTVFYQPQPYGTVYLLGTTGLGANQDFFRDFRCGDIGVDAVENNGTYVALGNPQSTEPGPTIDGYLGYDGSSIKLFTDAQNSPRSKTFEAGGVPGTYPPYGNVGVYALAASSGTTFRDSPKYRLIGTSWTGAASLDSIGFVLLHVIDATGAKELQLGFEAGGAGSGTVRSLAILRADKGITFATSADPAVAGVWFDGTEIFVQATNGPIFLRTVAGSNNNALVGSSGAWVSKDGAGATRNTLDDGSGNSLTALKKTVANAVATTAGGSTTGFLSFGSAAALGIYFGSGVPTITAPQGSLYLRTDGSSASTRAYINTTGSTVWTAITTAA